MITLVPSDQVRPSTYNPRTADPVRLDIIELSLRKLGFLLPIYADPEGEILSGHQRHHVATRMGVTMLPIARTKPMELRDRKAVNIVFNRGTNDLSQIDTPKNITEALERSNVYELAAKLPDLEINTPAFYPCMNARPLPIRPLLEANRGKWVDYARNISKTLRDRGVVMPIVCTPDLVVVNGIGRLQMLAELHAETVSVVTISHDQAALADAMLNLLSMDFDIHTRYADTLRFNSFRRARTTRKWLGYGFTFVVHQNAEAKGFDILKPADRARWVREHGESVVDFGAGHLIETELLRKAGIHVSPFEPFRITPGTDQVNPALSREVARAWLADVAAGVQYSSVFISSVLNSVPFEQDRQHIARILHALCGPTTKLYALAVGADAGRWTSLRGRSELQKHANEQIGFQLSYEPRIAIGEINDVPKVQKFHTQAEFSALFQPLFQIVRPVPVKQRVALIASRPKGIDRAALRDALLFEFDLPYPDQSRMGLVAEALAAFSKRIGVEL